MKKIFRIGLGLFGVVGLFFEAIPAFSGEIYFTTKGALFQKIDFQTFGPAWKAPNGTLWSRVIGFHRVSNGRTENGAVVESDAMQLCKALGGDLPSKEEIKGLLRYFNLYAPKNSQERVLALRDLYYLFPDFTPVIGPSGAVVIVIWTKTPSEHYADHVVDFDTQDISFASTPSKYGNSVVCVTR